MRGLSKKILSFVLVFIMILTTVSNLNVFMVHAYNYEYQVVLEINGRVVHGSLYGGKSIIQVPVNVEAVHYINVLSIIGVQDHNECQNCRASILQRRENEGIVIAELQFDDYAQGFADRHNYHINLICDGNLVGVEVDVEEIDINVYDTFYDEDDNFESQESRTTISSNPATSYSVSPLSSIPDGYEYVGIDEAKGSSEASGTTPDSGSVNVYFKYRKLISSTITPSTPASPTLAHTITVIDRYYDQYSNYSGEDYSSQNIRTVDTFSDDHNSDFCYAPLSTLPDGYRLIKYNDWFNYNRTGVVETYCSSYYHFDDSNNVSGYYNPDDGALTLVFSYAPVPTHTITVKDNYYINDNLNNLIRSDTRTVDNIAEGDEFSYNALSSSDASFHSSVVEDFNYYHKGNNDRRVYGQMEDCDFTIIFNYISTSKVTITVVDEFWNAAHTEKTKTETRCVDEYSIGDSYHYDSYPDYETCPYANDVLGYTPNEWFFEGTATEDTTLTFEWVAGTFNIPIYDVYYETYDETKPKYENGDPISEVKREGKEDYEAGELYDPHPLDPVPDGYEYVAVVGYWSGDYNPHSLNKVVNSPFEPVMFIYRRIGTPKSNLSVIDEYYDNDNNMIDQVFRDIEKPDVGAEYSFNPLDPIPEGYKYIGVDDNWLPASGTINTTEPTAVIFKYKRKTNVNINVYTKLWNADESSVIRTDLVDTSIASEDDEYSITAPVVDDFVLTDYAQTQTGVVHTSDINIYFNYREVSSDPSLYPVIVEDEFWNEDGTVKLRTRTRPTEFKYEGETYTYEALDPVPNGYSLYSEATKTGIISEYTKLVFQYRKFTSNKYLGFFLKNDNTIQFGRRYSEMYFNDINLNYNDPYTLDPAPLFGGRQRLFTVADYSEWLDLDTFDYLAYESINVNSLIKPKAWSYLNTVNESYYRENGSYIWNPDTQELLFYLIQGAGHGIHIDGVIIDKTKARLDFDPNCNDWSGVSLEGADYTIGTDVEVTDCTLSRANYVFTGWNTKADGSGETYNAGDIITVNERTVLYAQWESTVASYKIKLYDAFSGQELPNELNGAYTADLDYSNYHFVSEFNEIGTIGDTVTITYDDILQKWYEANYDLETYGATNYTLSEDDFDFTYVVDDRNILSAEINEDGSTILKVYVKFNSYDFSLSYMPLTKIYDGVAVVPDDMKHLFTSVDHGRGDRDIFSVNLESCEMNDDGSIKINFADKSYVLHNIEYKIFDIDNWGYITSKKDVGYFKFDVDDSNMYITDIDGNIINDYSIMLETSPVAPTCHIIERNITISSASLQKEYDGTALKNGDTIEVEPVEGITIVNNGTITEGAFVEGEGIASYEFTGSQTQVGSCANSFTYTLKNNTKAENYNIVKCEGILDVLEKATTPTTPVPTQNQNPASSEKKHYVVKVVDKFWNENMTHSNDKVRFIEVLDEGTAYRYDAQKRSDYFITSDTTKAGTVYKETEIYFTYRKKYTPEIKVYANKYSEDGKTVIEKELVKTITGLEGEVYNVAAPEVQGFTIIDSETTRTGKVGQENIEIVFDYQKNTVDKSNKYKITVIDRYLNCDGSKDHDDIRLVETKKENSKYSYKVLSVKGYEVTSEETYNGVVTSDIKVIFLYRKEKAENQPENTPEPKQDTTPEPTSTLKPFTHDPEPTSTSDNDKKAVSKLATTDLFYDANGDLLIKETNREDVYGPITVDSSALKKQINIKTLRLYYHEGNRDVTENGRVEALFKCVGLKIDNNYKDASEITVKVDDEDRSLIYYYQPNPISLVNNTKDANEEEETVEQEEILVGKVEE